ncbi:helix-turn-helix transcriptional regulator [Christiangramia sp. SM2212]|uniref:Helix-turn-helix transcriptional regulator n=1 Tax=Christiangramia sediminicola TaxID=3073267 RepID=A0ABU1ERK3_9FLAO|nr:helix-turn-helix transcriptional regulator [Christiangramia sp. SM2212]MDR5591015.1 helix-turn-helix transcriptional regulator [Christiangramia sp. SM2212]
MPEDILRIKSISQFHELIGFEKPKHPLISIIDVSKVKVDDNWFGKKFTTSLYSIALKDASCAFEYGRNHYDFNEGVMIFTGPDQVIKTNQEQPMKKINGWMMYFHPDLIRNTSLGTNIENYSFFSYDVHEALHLSDQEQNSVTDCVNMIQQEVSERIDNHSQRVIVSSLELLLNLCNRYYERQFNTRTASNKDIVSQMEILLKNYYLSGKLSEQGQPTMQYCADELHLSPNYLSDLLKKETGRSAKDHISDFVVDKAKTMLLGSTESIGEIAYQLGYNYPHYFSRFFKSKTGFSPQEYRTQN